MTVFSAQAQSSLSAGDIAFVGLNSNGGSENDEFSFILLRDITTGTKLNFSVNVKFNPAGNNAKGRVQFLVRRLESDGLVHLYRFRSNKLTSLAIDPLENTATITGKLNIQDITDSNNPMSGGGNNIFQVTLQDNGEPGFGDVIGFTVFGNGGGLLFSSNWSGVITEDQNLAGGNLKVHTLGNSLLSVGDWETPVGETPNISGNLWRELSLFPNPANDRIELVFHTDLEERAVLRILDLNGKVVRTGFYDTFVGANRTTLDLHTLPSGLYWLSVQLEQGVTNKKFVISRD